MVRAASSNDEKDIQSAKLHDQMNMFDSFARTACRLFMKMIIRGSCSHGPCTHSHSHIMTQEHKLQV